LDAIPGATDRIISVGKWFNKTLVFLDVPTKKEPPADKSAQRTQIQLFSVALEKTWILSKPQVETHLKLAP